MPNPPVLALTVQSEDDGRRLDQILSATPAAKANALSRTRIKALIEDGAVVVDGLSARDPALKLRAGAQLRLMLPPPQETALKAEPIALSILYEDDDLIVLDKPAGLVVHPAPGHATGTLVQALINHCGQSLSGVGGVRRPGIVHRLDKDTSGLMVVAKNDFAHQALSRQFADHGRSGPLEREYVALLWGGMPAPSGAVDAPLGRHATSREKIAVRADGREAVTHWRLIEALGPASLVACRLETGRTHQIRVHMAKIGCPLVGDLTYGSGFKTKAALLGEKARAALLNLNRQALHAAMLGFEHPRTGQPMRFESAPPEDLAALIRALRDEASGPK